MAGVKRDTITESRLLNRAIPTRGAGLVGYIPDATDAVGRTVADKLAEVYSVKDFGAVGDGMADDTWAIQSAINAVVASGQMGVVYIPSGVYRITSGLVVDCGYVSIYGYGAKIDASEMTSGTAMRLHGTAKPSYRQICSSIEGIQLIGTNQTNTVEGVWIYGNASTTAAANISIKNCYIDGFASGIRFGSHAYLVGVYSTNIRHCAKGVYVPYGLENAMEGVDFISCTIMQSTRLVDHQHGGLYFFGCSLDHCYEDLIYVNGARLFLYGCHLEDTDFTQTPITVTGSGGRLEMFGGGIGTTAGSDTLSCDYIIDCDSTTLGGGVFIWGTTLNSLRTATDSLTTGTGMVVLDKVGYVAQWYVPRSLGAGQNKLADGGFELASIVDNFFISADTAAITDRTNGTNIDLAIDVAEARSGGQSLLCTTGAGATAKFAVAVPITVGGLGNFELYYKKPGAETGSGTIRDYYAIVGVNSNGVPTILKYSTHLQSNALSFTSDPTDWTRAYGTHVHNPAPHWATHYVVEFNLGSFPNAKLYVDDFVVTVK